MALIVNQSLTVNFRNILCPPSCAGELTPGPEEESAVGHWTHSDFLTRHSRESGNPLVGGGGLYASS